MTQPSSLPRPCRARDRWVLAAAVVAAAGLLAAGFWWPPPAHAAQSAAGSLAADGQPPVDALAGAARLLLAGLVGLLITFVRRYARSDQPLSRSMEQAHILLCVAGALTMMIIGGSLARAFGIAGAASVIRFRTPVDDPCDTTVLFLLMALGMAAGLGLVGVTAVGTLFLCVCLLAMRHTASDVLRSMKVALVADGPEFPVAHVSRVFAEHHISVAPLEVSHGEHTTVRYRAVLEPDASIEQVSTRLMGGGTAGLKSVSWEAAKKGQ